MCAFEGIRCCVCMPQRTKVSIEGITFHSSSILVVESGSLNEMQRLPL